MGLSPFFLLGVYGERERRERGREREKERGMRVCVGETVNGEDFVHDSMMMEKNSRSGLFSAPSHLFSAGACMPAHTHIRVSLTHTRILSRVSPSHNVRHPGRHRPGRRARPVAVTGASGAGQCGHFPTPTARRARRPGRRRLYPGHQWRPASPDAGTGGRVSVRVRGNAGVSKSGG